MRSTRRVTLGKRAQKDEICLTLQGLKVCTGIPFARIREMVQEGLITPASERPLLFPPEASRRILKIERLSSHLSLNLSVVGVVIDLVDRLEALERELEGLRRRGITP